MFNNLTCHNVACQGFFLTVSDIVSPEKLKQENGCSIEKAHQPYGNNIPETHINVIFYDEGVFPEYPCDFAQAVLNTDRVAIA